MSHLKQQYKVVTIVFIIIAVLFRGDGLFGLQTVKCRLPSLTGGFFSGLAGFFGMKTAACLRDG